MPDPGQSSSSLVEQIREEKVRSELERKKAKRRRRRLRFAGVLLGLGIAAAGGLAVYQVVQQQEVSERHELAQAALATGRPAQLEKAAEALGANLELTPGDPATLGLLALVRVHQFHEGQIGRADVDAAIDRAEEAGADEASLAKGLIAGLEGDADSARRAYEANWNGEANAEAIANEVAWLHGLVALGQPFDDELLLSATAKVLDALENDPSWAPNRRIAADLLMRQRKLERALTLVADGRSRDAEHLGLAADDVLLHAMMGKQVEGAKRAGRQLLGLEGLSSADAATLRLAFAIIDVDDGDYDDAIEAIQEAWPDFPAWDRSSRDFAIDVVLTAGETELAAEFIDDMRPGAEGKAIYSAWMNLLEGKTREALEILGETDQKNPQVARLQALSLVEQQRWPEAKRWLDYLGELKIERPEIEVARRRVTLAMNPDLREGVGEAIEELEAIAKRAKRTQRVWTALAEHHVRLAHRDEASEAIEDAIEIEPVPGQAYRLRAEMLAKDALEDPDNAVAAREAFAKAVEVDPHDRGHRVRLGLHLAFMGLESQAIEVLEPAVTEASNDGVPEADASLTLAKLVSRRAIAGGEQVPDDVEAWLKDATVAGADPHRIALERARYELAQRTEASLQTARSRLETVLAALPRDIEVRSVLADVLIGQGETSEARSMLNRGIARTLRVVDGPLYIALARVEVAAGNKRRAASVSFKGWRKMYAHPDPPMALLDGAPIVCDLWVRISQPRGARTVSRELTKRVPYVARSWILRAEMEFNDGNTDEGCEAADKALELAPDSGAAMAARGDCLTRRFDFDAAREAYGKAAKLAEGRPEAREYLRKLRRL